MNDAKQPPRAARGGSGVEDRISEVERWIARAEGGRAEPGDRMVELEAELGQMRQAVTDLSAQNLDLHNQLDRLVSSSERLLAGGADEGAAFRRSGGLQRTASLMERAARKAVRGTVGVARRLAGGRKVEPGALPDVHLRVRNTPEKRSPRIAMVLRTSEDPEVFRVPDSVRRQTDSAFDLVVWNENTAKAVVRVVGEEPRTLSAPDPSSVAEALAADFIADPDAAAERLHPTIVERCRWTLASEGLPLLVEGDSPRRGWRMELKTTWGESGSDGDAPVTPKLVKAVGGGGWGAPDGLSDPSVAEGVGRGYMAAAGTKETLEHSVAPLNGVVERFSPERGRPAVLVVTSSRGAEVAAWILRRLGEELRFTVIFTDGSDGSPIVRGLTELAHRTYPVGGYLEPAVWPSLITDLARAHGAGIVLRIDAPVELPPGDDRPQVIDIPLETSTPVDGAGLVLALGAGLAAATRDSGSEVVELIPGPMLPGEMPGYEELNGVRAAHGVPDDARLVLTIADLDFDHRPEDVTAVARRLRHREDIHFLLVGRGPLAGTVSDLAGYFGLDRFTFAPPGHPIKELVAVSDCVLSTAEVDPWPVSVSAALALGRSVVATEIDGVRELVAAADFDRCALCDPGDVEALSVAVVAAVDGNRKPRITQKAWNAAARRSTAAARVVAGALDQRAIPGTEAD